MLFTTSQATSRGKKVRRPLVTHAPTRATILPSDASAGEALKDEALDRLGLLRSDALEFIRTGLVELLRQRGDGSYVTGDDAAELYDRWPQRDDELPRAFLGSVFKDKRFIWTGQFVKSSQKQNHARLLYCWKAA